VGPGRYRIAYSLLPLAPRSDPGEIALRAVASGLALRARR
jgi:hypothetical protein